jgi:hypothetical protein
MRIATGSAVGAAGDTVTPCLRLSLMAAPGDMVEVLALEHAPGGSAQGADRYLLPLSPLTQGVGHTLVRLDRSPAATRLTEVLCVALGRGTRITLPDGRQRPVEALVPGDRVLTRDHGPQPLRWVGRASLRAQGAQAPVVIGAGELGNAGDLVVGPHHRVFLYRRDRPGGLATAELLVEARHLVDGARVARAERWSTTASSSIVTRSSMPRAWRPRACS